MNFFKRILFYFIIALFLWSIRDDLTNKSIVPNKEPDNSTEIVSNQHKIQMNEVIRHKAKQGDTVLSIAEGLNGGSLPVSAEQLITDFQTANPTADPYHLEPGKTYYYPVY